MVTQFHAARGARAVRAQPARERAGWPYCARLRMQLVAQPSLSLRAPNKLRTFTRTPNPAPLSSLATTLLRIGRPIASRSNEARANSSMRAWSRGCDLASPEAERCTL